MINEQLKYTAFPLRVKGALWYNKKNYYSTSMAHIIRKQTGEEEPFNLEKLVHSLEKAGAKPEIAWNIAENVAREHGNMTTSRDIHKTTLHTALQHDRKLAIMYNLKQALMDLGPSGYPFEKYMAALMRRLGYQATTNLILPGRCVTHEIDVYLEKPEEHIIGITECKFRNQPGSKIDVKVPLYFDSRLRDVCYKLDEKYGAGKNTYEGWLITNTKFTGDALMYGRCAGLHLLGWTYPEEHSIAKLIERFGLIPITAMTSLTFHQKRLLLSHGIVLCSELSEHMHLLHRMGVSGATIALVEEDISHSCGGGLATDRQK